MSRDNANATPKDIIGDAMELATGLYRDGATKNIDPRQNTATSFVTGFHSGLEWAVKHPAQAARLNKELHDIGDLGHSLRTDLNGEPQKDITVIQFQDE